MNRQFLCFLWPALRSRCYSTVTQQSQRTGRPLRLAVIGAGPAGFYTSYRVLSKLTNAYVDMYESLPVPYGLVRFGVAPDHPEVKNCQAKFEEVAASPRFTYIGNTPIGTSWPHPPHRSLPLSAITTHYDALLLSYGASKDRRLGIPGEDLEGVYSARAFVGWYNGLPEYADLGSKLLLDSAEEAVIIGQGNVALDVARILLTDVDVLRKTDIAAHAVEALSRSRVKRVRVVGRRGPLQAAFTVKELRELLSIPNVGFTGLDPTLIPEDTKALSRQQKRIAQILEKGSKTLPGVAHKQWGLDFLRSPSSFQPAALNATTLGFVRFEKTWLEDRFSSTARALPTSEHEDMEAQMAFRSIGYLSEPIPGFPDAGIPFNEKRGLVPNEDGRVVRPGVNPDERGEVVPGVYTSGWVKRGPTGVIASTMYDAFETADAIVNDWVSGEREFMDGGEKAKRGWEAVQGEVKERGMRPVSWEEWRKIDAAEKQRGARLGKEREKFVREEDMLAVLE
ncbi:hypothetical protein FN846DRAFT_969987 [Sphaerosporella brunnea]|uniref:NADPH:adrenodoxin oxidoreductase, mitochondrial n=1 Tax=Sphaerosporella brunnea TaxID=1250544 RepID=A0A5J5EJX2_9PEZI|nr:hypothetical protein FN846DRAFT_969987 [Sphaerosporella brunnea]